MIAMTLRVNDRDAQAGLRALIIKARDPQPALRQVGAAMKSRIKLGFRESTAPDGTPWAPIRHRRGKPLLDTGRLRNSITFQTSRASVAIGTNVQYAPVHQFGLLGVTPRPFIPINELPANWAQEVLDITTAYMARRK